MTRVQRPKCAETSSWDCDPRCRLVRPEEERIARPGRRDVADATLASMCSDGRHVYHAYLRWLAEPDQ